MNQPININLEFYGRLQSQFAGQSTQLSTAPGTVKAIYQALCEQHQQTDESAVIKPILNDTFCDWQDRPAEGDTVGFFPPASGG